MANVDARINVTANIGQADRELRRLQGRLNAVERAANLELGDIIRTGGIQRSIQTVNQLDRAVSSLRSSIRSINSPGGGNLGDAIRVAATASNEFFDSLARGDRYLSNTISGLREQSNAFAVLASNINSASDRFADYVQGAQAAQDKGLRPLFRQFEALRQLYEEGITGRGIEIDTAEMGAGFFERLSQEIPQTEAALRAFSAELTRVRGLISSESVAAFGIEQQIIEIEQQLLRIEQDRLETRAALNREMSAPVQGALSRMEGRQADPFGVPDEQINEVLNQRAEEYVRQQGELSSLQQVLSAMEGKKYDPLNIADEQINQGLNERAAEYRKQASELSDLQRTLSSMESKRYDPLNVSDEQINAGLNERAAQYQRQAGELSELQRILGGMEGKKYDPMGISDQQINAGLNERAAQYQRQLDELAALQRTLSTMEGKKYDPLNVSDEQINQSLNLRAQEYAKQQDELLDLQRTLSSMEGARRDPLGISDEQVNQALNQRASAYEQQTREIAALQQALGSLEQRKVDWGTALGIDETEVASRRARELEVEWNRLDQAAQALAAQAPQAAAALAAFKFEALAESANTYTRALLNQQRTLDEYTDSASRAARAAAELGYGGELPALRPAGFTNQDVRIKNLLDDQQAAAKIVAELEINLDKMVNNLELENIQREMVAEIDSIEMVLERRKKAGEEWWAGEKARLDERDAIELASAKKAADLRGRRRRAISEGLIGGAFPLLFGQGIGAAALGGAGGALGGFAGGGLGFGLSLVGTALGTAFDTLSQAAQDTGAALNYPIEGFEKLKEAGLFASRQQEYYISKLIETGRTAEATAKIQARVVEVIGVQGTNDLMALGDSASLLGKKWSELNYQMQALVAGPVGGFLELLAKVAGAKVESNRLVGLGERISRLTPEQRRIFQEEARKISAADYTKGAEALLDKIAPQQLKQAKEDPAQVERDLNRSIETAEKVRALRQQGTALERNAQDLRLSIEDTVYGLRKRAADMEREAAEFRRSVEDQVFSKRQELEQKLIENDRKRQQNAIDTFDLQLQRASTGLDPIAQGIVDAARQYLRVRAEGEADLQQNERRLKLQLQQIDQEVARYKLQVEDRISQMSIQRDEFTRDVAKTKLQLERQIGDYVIQVEEYRLAMAKHRYELEIDLEKKKQIAAQGGLMGGGGPVDQLMGAASQREKFVQDQLVRRGFTPEQMAAVMGSIRQESGFNPYAKEQGGTGLGLFQWSFDRRSKVPAFTGNWQKDIQNQLDLFQRELNTTEKKAGEILMGATTLQGAAAGMKQFERYGVAGRRYDYMKDYYARFTGGAGVPVSQQMESGFTEAFDLNAPAPARSATPTMPELPSAPQLAQVNDLLAQYVDLQERLKKALQDNNLAEARRVQLQIESARLAFEQQALSPIRQFQEQNRELQFEIEKRQVRNRLLAEGVKPEIVEGELRVLEISRTLNSVLQGLEETTNQQVKAELERAGSSSDLIDSTFRLTEATLASLAATTQDIKKQEELRKKLQEILDLRDKLAGKAKSEAGGAAAGARGIAAQQASDFQKAQDAMAKMKSDLDQLIDKVNQAKFASETFGNAFAGGITDSISAFTGLSTMTERRNLQAQIDQFQELKRGAKGNKDAVQGYKQKIAEARSEMDKLKDTGTQVQNALANMLKGIGEAFVEMAQKIIAQQVTMIIFGTILKALGIAASASGGGGGDYTSGNVVTDAFTGGGGIPGITKNPASIGTPSFAKGGMFTNSVVSSPTLFQFADGGVTRTGVMGEAGPEAIMPLERGADGKLGVKAKLSGAMTRYRRPPGTDASADPGSGDSGSGGGGVAVAAPIDVRYTVERINSVDYVTADQFQTGLRQAADQGARQGERRALTSLRQNTATRRKVGI